MTAWAPGVTWVLISARCRFIACVLTNGRRERRPLRERDRRRRRCRPSRTADRAVRGGGCPCRPRYRSGCLVDRRELRLATRARSACRVRARGWRRQPARQIFFVCLLSLCVLFGVTRTHGKAREVEPRHQLAHRTLVQLHAEMPGNLVAATSLQRVAATRNSVAPRSTRVIAIVMSHPLPITAANRAPASRSKSRSKSAPQAV